MENNIEVNNLSKKYDGFELKNINFAVPKGSIVGFVGENGAGKTTTIKSILNITNANGNIKILGKDIKQHEKEIKQNIGVVLDDSFLSDYLTAKQINSIMKDIYKEWNESKYINYLKQFNLPTNKLLKDYSTSGLDPVVRNEILDIFRNYIEEDETRSIFISTHITTDLEHISDYIVFIEKGEIIFNIPTAELLENYGIIKCSKEEFLNIDKQDYIRFKKEKYQYEVLTDNKENII